MNPLSLRARLTLWYVVVLVAVLVLGAASVLWTQQRLGVRRIDQELDTAVATVANVVRGELNEQNTVAGSADEAIRTVSIPGRAVAVLDADGKRVAANLAGLELNFAIPTIASGLQRLTIQTSSGTWRILARPERFDQTTTLMLFVAAPLGDVLREQRGFKDAMLVGIPFVLVLAAAGGLWLARVGLRPISAMADRAARVEPAGTEDLGGDTRTDEIGQLARAFNALLGRFRATLRTQRQFMADASHELRTPVSIVRTAADVALDRPTRTEAEYREALSIIGAESRRMSRLITDMLVLARADSGGYPLRHVNLYLDELVADCARAVSVLARERGVAVSVSDGCEIPFRGDEDLLRQLVVNLLQNAVQHSPSGGVVTVQLDRGSDAVSIAVRDTGAGIPEDARTRIFDRFVRLDGARQTDGTGLGLPIARWIAEAHGGRLVLEASSSSGSTFKATLPVARAES